ncbi:MULTISPECIES: carboxymuconolactone decarboxylase family protein [unclassified Paraburkholderia]|uniref:carboxymuconolactone decarboxylase family protein n=1 Tax=unclassified Paraburkholderia TaxID=2615204 RepID=UPI00161C6943|nr:MULTISPECIES: carboxymuconolactone decarboxylase family protein [unclassified Paraburkholderia]MBB5447791.1 alkylhydroperoxidase family enzyme [Paraburkholderia sp. WSM4177]MBB5488272.1 alkylhydroperoxidase family enzyme [Paraburkholderia sp. WSM4180]
MRLVPIPPPALSSEQQSLYESIDHVVSESLRGFTAKSKDGALLGPFNPMVHFPQYGSAAWMLTVALAKYSKLPKPVKEVAILTVGSAHKAPYEIYAHERVARLIGLPEKKIKNLATAQRPVDLTDEEAVAYDVAASLMAGGPLPGNIYKAAVLAFGTDGAAELIFLIANYSLVSVLLNAYDIPVPGSGE